MGAVYLATHLALDKSVAIKEILSSNPASLRQFEIEATILASLAHPNLPNVMDFFVEPNGSRYLVMEFVECKNLEQIVAKRGRLRKDLALRWMAQIFEAVEYIHANGIIHRDIKPQNIIITPQDQAVLVDFGISKVLASGQSTLTGARAGTAGYAPPEQYRGGTDERSDVYALGATLYFLLTGQVPQSALPRAAGAPLTPPRQLNPAIAPNIETVVLTAMSLAANQRYASVSEMKGLLLVETPVVVRESKRSLQSVPLAVAGLVLVVLVLAVLLFRYPGQPELTGGVPAATLLIAVSSPTGAQVALALPSNTPTATPSLSPTATLILPTPSPSAIAGPMYRLDAVSGSDYYPKFWQVFIGGTDRNTDPFTAEVKVAVNITNLANGTQSRLFERPSEYYGTITSAIWSHDGNSVLIAYGWRGVRRHTSEYQYRFENGSSGVIRLDGGQSEPQNLSSASFIGSAGREFSGYWTNVDFYRDAIWSPDGGKIAVLYREPESAVSAGWQCPGIMNADGSGFRRLNNCELGDHPRYWSVDGKWIIVWSEKALTLYAYEVDGNRRTLLYTLQRELGRVPVYDQRYFPWRVTDQPKCEGTLGFWSCE
jgi:serine/threonine-protein kinase